MRLMTEHKNLYYLTFRIRKLLLSAIGMSRSMVINEALEVILLYFHNTIFLIYKL